MYAIVDIETTGAHLGAHSITEIAIILHDGKRIVETFESLINPQELISPYVARLTGINNEMLADAPLFHEVAKKIWTMTEGAVFVAHSVNFDYSFIREEFRSLGADFRRSKLCTVRLSRKVFPGQNSYSLGNICASLGIPIENRHRAMGDAQATVKLFEKCLEYDADQFVGKSLNRHSKEAKLPPLLPAEVFYNLPEKTGVYYFHDQKGKVIYVGKAINIRKRVLSHFTGSSTYRLSFHSAIANITYALCGTELIALLLESREIKRLFPIYNQAQKFDRSNFILTHYTDQQGIKHLLFARNNKRLEALRHFRSFDSAREYVFRLISEYHLCPKCCGIQTGAGPCFDHRIGKCRGVCAGKEEIKKYNKRVERAMRSLHKELDTKVIIDEGREYDERSVILIEDGVYKGFGYFPASKKIDTPEDARAVIEPANHNPDIQRILARYVDV